MRKEREMARSKGLQGFSPPSNFKKIKINIWTQFLVMGHLYFVKNKPKMCG